MSYFISLKKVIDNTATVVHSVLPAIMENKRKIHSLFLGIFEIIAQLGQ